jgi:hypothetical protein
VRGANLQIKKVSLLHPRPGPGNNIYPIPCLAETDFEHMKKEK